MMSASRGCRAVQQDVGLSLASLYKQRRTQEKYLGTTKSISTARAAPGFRKLWRAQSSAKKILECPIPGQYLKGVYGFTPRSEMSEKFYAL